MMALDMGWLSSQAQTIHSFFTNIFYALMTVMLLIGVLLEYFKWPIGGMPSFANFIGRAFVAALLLHSYPEVSNVIADFMDAVSEHLGGLHQLEDVLGKLSERMDKLSPGWIGIKESVIAMISFLSFFLLYISVHAINAFLLLSWTLLYVFSPLLIASYVLPANSGATKALYRSLIEVSLWKITWSVLATLLWSSSLSSLNQPGYEVSFLSAIFMNLMLAGSLVATPMIVHALVGAGITSLAQAAGGFVGGALMAAPVHAARSVAAKGVGVVKGTYGLSKGAFAVGAAGASLVRARPSGSSTEGFLKRTEKLAQKPRS